MLALEVLGWIGAVTSVAPSVAQVIRARRVGVEGVSINTWALMFVANFFWFGLGLHLAALPMMVNTALAGPIMLWLLVLFPWPRTRRALAMSFAVGAVIILLPALLFGWPAGVAGVTALALALRLPQIQAIRHSEFAVGVSITTWWIATANNAIWALYGLSIHDRALLLSNIAQLLGNLVIIGLALHKRSALRQRQLRADVHGIHPLSTPLT
jgi:uncharacterized protein with PQ loop repeat